MHLDLFQRINAGPRSVPIVRYGESRPSAYAADIKAGDRSWLSNGIHSGDAPVGGGAGQAP
jgi:hypothetical protein